LFLGLKPKSYQQLQLSLQSFCLQAFPPFFAPFCFFALFPSFIGLFRLRKGAFFGWFCFGVLGLVWRLVFIGFFARF